MHDHKTKNQSELPTVALSDLMKATLDFTETRLF